MKTAKGYFDMGYEARYQGQSREANPLLFGNGWPHEAWNLGFEFAELEINAPRQSEAVLERVPANPFKQGQNSHIRGVALADCPYGEGHDRLAWEAGWISQQDKGSELGAAKGCFSACLIMVPIVAAIMWASWYWGWLRVDEWLR